MKPTILYIDDAPSNLFLVELIAEEQGIRLETAISGQLGLQKTKEKEYNLILSDIRLPDITGFQILKELRFESANMFTPVIAFTADVTTSNQRKIVEHGFTAFLSKPFKEDDLLRIFEVILNSTSLSLDLMYYKKYIRESIQYKKAKEIIINELRDFENNISLALFDNNFDEIENQIHKISFLLSNLKLATMLNLVEELKQKTTNHLNYSIPLMKMKSNLLSMYRTILDDRNWEVLS